MFFLLFLGVSSCTKMQSRSISSTTSLVKLKCVQWDSSKAFSFNPWMDQSPNLINNVQYPRNSLTKYRGLRNDVEMNEELFMKSVSGAPGYYFSTYSHEKISSLFLDKINDKEIRTNIKDYLSINNLEENYKTIKKCLDKLSEDERVVQANVASALLIDLAFEKRVKKNSDYIVTRYLDYKSKVNVDYAWQNTFPSEELKNHPLRRGELLFSSVNYSVSHNYSKTYVVSFREEDFRSIDLNYFNYLANNNEWNFHPNDEDEFITPGYVRGTDLTSLEVLSKNIVLIKTFYTLPDDSKMPLIVVMRSSFYDEKFSSGIEFKELIKSEIPLIGIIEVCSDGISSCKGDKSEFKEILLKGNVPDNDTMTGLLSARDNANYEIKNLGYSKAYLKWYTKDPEKYESKM